MDCNLCQIRLRPITSPRIRRFRHLGRGRCLNFCDDCLDTGLGEFVCTGTGGLVTAGTDGTGELVTAGTDGTRELVAEDIEETEAQKGVASGFS